MITYPLNVAVRILTARNYFLPQGITYRLPRLPILTARNYLPQGISSLVSLLVSSFGILTVRILTVSNFLELLTAALPQGIPYLLAVSRNYNYSCRWPPPYVPVVFSLRVLVVCFLCVFSVFP